MVGHMSPSQANQAQALLHEGTPCLRIGPDTVGDL